MNRGKTNEKKKKLFSLRKKIAGMGAFLVLLSIVSFVIVGTIQLRGLSGKVKKLNDSQVETTGEYSQILYLADYLDKHNKLLKLSAKYLDQMLLNYKTTLSVLCANAEMIGLIPDSYPSFFVPAPVSDSDGNMTPQLLLPDKGVGEPSKKSVFYKLAGMTPTMDRLISENKDTFSSFTVVMPDGVSLCYDEHAKAKLDENGKPVYYDPREESWYKDSLKKKDLVYSVKMDAFEKDNPEIVMSKPVYTDYDKLLCVLVLHLSIRGIEDSILKDSVDCKDEQLLLFDSERQLIATTKASGELSVGEVLKGDIGNTLKDAESKKRLEMIWAKEEDDSLDALTLDGKDYVLYRQMIPSSGWNEMILIDSDEAEKAPNMIMDSFKETGKETEEAINAEFRSLTVYMIILLAILMVVTMLLTIRVSGRITRPINLMTKKVQEITGDNIVFDMQPEYETRDEIGVLAQTFSHMSGRLQEQVEEIIEISAQKERMATELNVATRIQSGMLPKVFPLYPGRTEFSLFASMDPAREVGGDFYDVFLVDDDHLALVVADVSDKGVPAALFMVISKTLIKTRALQGGSPAEILTDVNDMLCDENEENLFVTVWLGILTISTGELKEANAGHEKPMVRKADGDFEIRKTKHGLVMGSMKGMKYSEDSMFMESGDVLFMYTDGVTEAMNTNEELFGSDRVIESLNTNKDLEPSMLLPAVREDIDAFVNGAVQFDDLTMLALKIS